jgi:dTDP-4-dehydrorhamnose 3,5-epimerase-like enzyme
MRSMSTLWNGLRPSARARLAQRDYHQAALPERIGSSGVEAGELLSANRADPPVAAAWIPGVEFFPRKVYPQRHRGFFGELARRDEGVAGSIGFWPRQWATARMFPGTAKGFHIHPPHIPDGTEPAAWFRRLYIEEPENFALRPYDREQWDMMFFLEGVAEMLLVDERDGMPRRVMRCLIDGDDHRGPNNAAVIIPAGIAHALRVESGGDLIMVYGTSTTFVPEFEGRIAAGVESAPLPREWSAYLGGEA